MTMIEHHKTLWYNSAYDVKVYIAKTGEAVAYVTYGELKAVLKARKDMSAGPERVS